MTSTRTLGTGQYQPYRTLPVAWPRLQLQEKHFESFYESNLTPAAAGCQFKVPVALLVRVPPVKVKPPPPLGPARTPSMYKHDDTRDDRSPVGRVWDMQGRPLLPSLMLISYSHSSTEPAARSRAASGVDRVSASGPQPQPHPTLRVFLHYLQEPRLVPSYTYHSPLILAPFDGEKVIVRKGQGPDLMR